MKSIVRKCATALLLALFMGGAVAEERSTGSDGASSPTVDDRYGAITGILATWGAAVGGGAEWEAEVGQALNNATDETLLAIQNATSYDEVRALLMGFPVSKLDGMSATEVLGAINQDLVYSPVFPCRIFDTRIVTAQQNGAPPTNNQTRQYYVHDGGLASRIALQGGNPAGCRAPKGEPVAISVNLAAIPISPIGHLRIYPVGGALPGASFLNYFSAGNVANSGIITTGFFSTSTRDINVFNRNTAHSFADVMGYFYPFPVNDPALNEVSFAGFSSGSPGTIPSDDVYRFEGPTDVVVVPSGGYGFLVNAMTALGTTAVAGANNLDVRPCYRLSSAPSTQIPTGIGGAMLNLSTTQGTRIPIPVTGTAFPPPGTYLVGLCAKTSSANWNNNEWGYVSAVVLRP